MCGDNSQQTEIQQQQAEFSQQMMQENAQVYGKQQGILDSLNSGFQAIIANGPSQKGFSDQQLTNLDTQSTEATAADMTKASQALGNGQAAQGGGDTFIPSGVKTQEQEQLAAAGATSDSSTKSQILQADYAQGNTNYNNAVAGSETVAADLNPVGYSDAATASSTAAANEANAIATSANSPFTAVMGALGGVTGAATGALIKNSKTT